MYVKMAKEYELTMEECPICLEPMVVGLVLRCQHIFHEACIDKWSAVDDSCPVCRTSLKAPRVSCWRYCWSIYTLRPLHRPPGT